MCWAQRTTARCAKMKIWECPSFERNGFNSGVFGLHAFRPVIDRIQLMPGFGTHDFEWQRGCSPSRRVPGADSALAGNRNGKTGGQILRLGFEIQKFPLATYPPCPAHAVTDYSVCLQCRSV